MNVQISPAANSADRGTTTWTHATPRARPARTLLIGGVALVAGAGRLLVFHPCQRARRRAAARDGAGEGGAGRAVGNMAVIEHTIGTVVANSTVRSTPACRAS